MMNFSDSDLAIIYVDYKAFDLVFKNKKDLSNISIIVNGIENDDICKIINTNYPNNIYFEVSNLLKNDFGDYPNIIYDFKLIKKRDIEGIKKINFTDIDNIYFKIILNLDMDVEEIEFIFEFIKEIKNINFIIDFDKVEENLGDKYLKVYTMIDECENLYIDRKNYLTDTLLKHPCNMCLCSGSKCHSQKSKYPKFVEVDENLNVYLYGSKKECGNLKRNALVEIIEDNSFHLREIMERVYNKYLFNYKYKYFPLNHYYQIEEMKDENK